MLTDFIHFLYVHYQYVLRGFDDCIPLALYFFTCALKSMSHFESDPLSHLLKI